MPQYGQPGQGRASIGVPGRRSRRRGDCRCTHQPARAPHELHISRSRAALRFRQVLHRQEKRLRDARVHQASFRREVPARLPRGRQHAEIPRRPSRSQRAAPLSSMAIALHAPDLNGRSGNRHAARIGNRNRMAIRVDSPVCRVRPQAAPPSQSWPSPGGEFEIAALHQEARLPDQPARPGTNPPGRSEPPDPRPGRNRHYAAPTPRQLVSRWV